MADYDHRYRVFQLVPQDPTDAMMKAGIDAFGYQDDDEEATALRVWNHMVDVATSECVDATVLTHSKFAMYVSWIAKNAANWAGETLTDYRYLNRVMDVGTVARFTDDIRGRLDMLDSLAGRSVPKAESSPNPLQEQIANIGKEGG